MPLIVTCPGCLCLSPRSGSYRHGAPLDSHIGKPGQVQGGAMTDGGQVVVQPVIGGLVPESAHVGQKAPAWISLAAAWQGLQLCLGTDHVQPRVPQPGQT